MATVEKIDMSLDDIIKLNKKKLQSGGAGGNRGGRGRGGRGRGRGGIARGQSGRGRRNSGVSPLKRADSKATLARGGRFSQNSFRGTRGGRGLRGTGRGLRGTSRGGRGNTGRFRGKPAGYGGQRGMNYKTRATGVRFNQRGKFSQRGSNYNNNNIRGQMSNRGWTSTRGLNRVNRGRGRGGVRGGARGGANLNQQREAVVEVIKKARRTLQQLNAQQKRQTVVSQKRGLTSPQITSPTHTKPQRKRQWNQRKIQPYNQQNANLSGDFTVLVDNNRSPPQPKRGGKSKKISNKIRQSISTTSLSSVEPKIQKAVFSKAQTSVSLNQRFTSQGRQVGSAIDSERQVFF